MNPSLVWLALTLWMSIAITIAYAAKRGMGPGLSEYFLAGRKLGGFVSAMTYSATTYSAFMLVGLVGLAYRTGVGALGFEMTYLMFTVLLLIAFGPRFWLVSRRYDYLTPPELLAGRYNHKWAGIIAAVISLVMLIPYSAIQLMGMGLLVEGLTDGAIPFMVGVAIMALFCTFATLWAGMRSVSWTDAFQALTMLLTSLFALFFIFFHFFGTPVSFFSSITQSHPDLLRISWTPAKFIGLALPWAFFALTNPQVSQRLFVSDSLSSLKRMIIYFSIFGFLYTLISILFGFQAASLLPNLENPDKAMAALLGMIPIPVALLMLAGIFAAASSTLGSIVLTLSSLVSRDIVSNLSPDVLENSELWIGKLTIPLIIGFSVLFAWLQPGMIAILSSMASGGLLVMAPAITGAFFWKKGTAAGAISSMVIGALATAIMYIEKLYFLGWWPSVWGLLITTVTYISVSLVTTPPSDTDQFFAYLERELHKLASSTETDG